MSAAEPIIIESNVESPLAELHKIAELVKRVEPTPHVTVRQLLSWFGAQRRGSYVVQTIRETLGRLGIGTVPDFNDVWIDSEVKFAPSLPHVAMNPQQIADNQARAEPVGIIDEQAVPRHSLLAAFQSILLTRSAS